MPHKWDAKQAAFMARNGRNKIAQIAYLGGQVKWQLALNTAAAEATAHRSFSTARRATHTQSTHIYHIYSTE